MPKTSKNSQKHNCSTDFGRPGGVEPRLGRCLLTSFSGFPPTGKYDKYDAQNCVENVEIYEPLSKPLVSPL